MDDPGASSSSTSGTPASSGEIEESSVPVWKPDLSWFAPNDRPPEPGEALDRAHDAIRAALKAPKYDASTDLQFLAGTALCNRSVPGYVTVDPKHSGELIGVIRSIKSYLLDETLKRPRNYLVLASPGSGKSHLVECIRKSVGGESVEVVAFNMATMRSREDLTGALDMARNVIVDRKTPIIFLDEFDTNDGEHFPLLLPLLWDGALHTGSRELRLGRCIFFMAGSSRDLPRKLGDARRCYPPADNNDSRGKELDLLSRISGSVIDVPSLSGHSGYEAAQRVLLAVSLLLRRFPKCPRLPIGLLRFISKTHFRYDARSVATLIDLITPPPLVPAEPEDNYQGLRFSAILLEHLETLPLRDHEKFQLSPLALHLCHKDGQMGLKGDWETSFANNFSQTIYDDDLPKLFDEKLYGIYLPKLLDRIKREAFAEKADVGEVQSSKL